MIYQKYFDKIIMVGRLFIFYQIFSPDRHGFSNEFTCIGCTGNAKVGCVFPMVIWSEFCMGQDRDNDHREDASHFTAHRVYHH